MTELSIDHQDQIADLDQPAVLSPRGMLDQGIDLTRLSWWSICLWLAVAAGAVLRLIGLDWVPLSVDEGERSFLALSHFDGRPLGLGQSLSDSYPATLLGQSLSFFLFGVTDVTARIPVVLAGIGIVIVSASMWRFTNRQAGLGMAVMAAFSPTLVYASRVIDSEILVAFFALLALFALLQAGRSMEESRAGFIWSGVLGVSIAAALASGPASISVLLAMGLAAAADYLTSGERGAIRSGLKRIVGSHESILATLIGFVVATVALFTLGFSTTSSLSDFPAIFSDWGRMLGSQSSATPTQFFLLAVLLYEAFALVAALTGFGMKSESGPGQLNQVFFLVWFAAALILFSFSSGREPEFAVHVALPLVLWGGIGLSIVVSALDWSSNGWKRSLALVAAVALTIAGVVALLAEMTGDQGSESGARTIFNVIVILGVAIVLPAAAAVYLAQPAGGGSRTAQAKLLGLSALVAMIGFLSLYTLRTTVELSFYRADTAQELLAQRTSTQAVTAFARQIENLSRDVSVSDGTVLDPTGGHSTTIAMEEDVAWPFQWYFRNFPNAEIVAVGAAPSTGADLVMTVSPESLDGTGYTSRQLDFRNRVPPEYATPSMSNVLKAIVLPSRWHEAASFLFFREGITIPGPEQTSVGYGPRLSNQLFPSSGPYDLSDRPGPGNGRGQFNEPRGVAVSFIDGSIYVVDMANGRVERFDREGTYVGTWGGVDSGLTFTVTEQGLGPTGIAVGIDGLVYVADTWAHRIVVLNESGQEVRSFGVFGDTLDAPDANTLPGSLFGPRSVAVTPNEIFVSDTGNERIQVFSPDGTFIRAWGGYGSGPSQFIEPVGVAVGPDGNVYVADSGNGRISVFGRDGTPLYQWAVASWLGLSYFEPYLAFDQNGNLYATTSVLGSIEAFDINGNPLGSITTANATDIAGGIGIALDYEGNLRVTDRSIPAVLEVAPLPLPEPAAIPTDSGTPAATPLAGGSPEADR